MNLETLAFVGFALAALPCGLFLLNLSVYRPLDPGRRGAVTPVSVLIPARNEEENLRASLDAVLANEGCPFEVIVLNDHSTDRTAEILAGYVTRDSRLRMESAPALPAGWCGKQHACHILSKLARHPLLVFIDADVRLAPDALERMSRFMEQGGVALASGVPRQELGTLSERLLIPLIHFVLLGFLPMHAMRRTRLPAMSAGCGQLFIARREPYDECGGHSRIKDSLHDGIKLPRVFRRAGHATRLFDATDLATCRMYRTNVETWRGLGRNATEGLAAPGTILPMTVFLLGGQVLPIALLLLDPGLSTQGRVWCVGGVAAAYLPRLLGVWRFRHPWGGTLLHPLGVLSLLIIQWNALVRRAAGKSFEWKGRSYRPVSGVEPAKAA